jgi:hypothetical protein
MTSGASQVQDSRFRRSATSELRRFEIPDLRKFKIPELRRLKIPDLRKFATSELRRFKIPDFASSRFLKTHFTNFIKLDVSRVTDFPEFPNTSPSGKQVDSDDPIPRKS